MKLLYVTLIVGAIFFAAIGSYFVLSEDEFQFQRSKDECIPVDTPFECDEINGTTTVTDTEPDLNKTLEKEPEYIPPGY